MTVSDEEKTLHDNYFPIIFAVRGISVPIKLMMPTADSTAMKPMLPFTLTLPAVNAQGEV